MPFWLKDEGAKLGKTQKKAGDTASKSRRQSLGKPTTVSDEKILMRFLSLSGMFSNMTLQLFGSTYGLDKLDRFSTGAF